MAVQIRVRGKRALWGRGLRFVLVDLIRSQGEVTVAQMVAHIADAGYEIEGRPSKVISDSLRWELRRGRVVRVGRGRYRYGRVPSSTARRMRILAERAQLWISAIIRGTAPPPTPPDPRIRLCGLPPVSPPGPPWSDFGWLWVL